MEIIMKPFKSILLIIVLLLSCALLLACSDEETCVHKDENVNGECDSCGESVPLPEGAINLIKNGVPTFQLVLGSDLTHDAISAVTDLADELSTAIGSEIRVVNDYTSNIRDVEILVGMAKSRGEEYKFDARVLGYEGYAVRFIGNKIVLLGGSDEALIKALDHISDKLLGTDGYNLTLTETDAIESPVTEFDVENVTIAGKDLGEFVIAIDKNSRHSLDLASYATDLIYKRTGISTETVALDELTDGMAAIVIEILQYNDARTTDEGFRIFTDEAGCLRIQTEFPEKLYTHATQFISEQLLNTENRSIEISDDFDYREDVRRIYYSEFGAVGDGKTDDYAAIRSAHEYANAYGHTVCANPGSRYYIGEVFGTIEIKTNVEWGDATFIIDDTKAVPAYGGIYIFTVMPDQSAVTYAHQSIVVGDAFTSINDAGGIKRDSFKKFDLGLGYPAMIKLINSNHKNYIRYGNNANVGDDQAEIILVDAEGNVSADTPLLFDYDFLTSAVVYRLDERKITLNGGKFVTVANDQPIETGYYARGVAIRRSGTTVKNLVHEITEEGDTGAPYIAFLYVSCASDVTVEDCTVQGRKNYGYMGSYDLNADTACNVVFKNVMQSNFFLDDGVTTSITGSKFWGIMGSNRCKNLVYDSCRLTRFDAHRGLYNGKIINSEIAAIKLTGGGEMLIEDSVMYIGTSATLIDLRSDYGSTWRGSVTIKNLNVIRTKKTSSLNLFNATWNNHDFGYRTYMPATVTVDNLTCNGVSKINLVTGTVSKLSYICDAEIAGEENLNPYTVTEKLIVRNCAGITFSIPTTEPFKSTVFINE